MPEISSQEKAEAEAAAAALEYCERIRLLGTPSNGRPVTAWPGHGSLLRFIQNEHNCKKPAGLSILNIPTEDGNRTTSGPARDISITPAQGYHGLLKELPSLTNANGSSTLIIVENICPWVLALLGGVYDIDPQFFAEHVNIVSWYRMEDNIPERLPSLPSTKKVEDFLTLKFMEPRELLPSGDAGADAGSILWCDDLKTRIAHSAGKLIPISRRGRDFPWLVFTRQTFSVWCRKKANDNGWIAIMLLDPPFQAKKWSVGQAEYRSPNLRPKLKETFHGDEHKNSFQQSFCHSLRLRCASDNTYLRACATNPFLVLFEGYRIIASEWLIANEYVKRELANIELRLEGADSTFQELEARLKDLYRIRRRCNKYCELVTEAASQCKSRGQPLWPSSKSSPNGNKDEADFTASHAELLEADFQYVLDSMNTSITRIEKDITLLMTLVSIGEGRQGLRENRGIALLTRVATIFMPSEAIATILGLQTRYAPGASQFWVLWVVALPITLLVIALPLLQSVGSAAANQLRAKVQTKKKIDSRPEQPPDSPQHEIVEYCNDPKQQLYRESVSAAV